MFPTPEVSFEFQEKRRRLAPYVNPKLDSKTIERDEYGVKTYGMPYISPKRVITNDTLIQKLLGEPMYNSDMTPADRAAKIAAQDILDLQDTIWRREEYMCARVKQDGKLTIKGTGINEEVDYSFENIAQEMRKDGINPDMLILGSKAANMLLQNERYLKLLDNRRVEIGEIRPGELENGIGDLGRMIVPGAMFDLYIYEEWVPDTNDLDENGEPILKPIIDPETVIIQN